MQAAPARRPHRPRRPRAANRFFSCGEASTGGVGTSMGLAQPKSLIEVKPGWTFLDVIARQALALRRRHGARLPLVLMNSFSTQRATLDALARYGDLAADVPLDFLQSRAPRL